MSNRAPSDRARQLMKCLRRSSGKGRRRFPVATLAFYGPDDRRASKLVASITESEGGEPTAMQKWHSDTGDVRKEAETLAEALAFIEANGARYVIMPDRIIGCPHADRWTGKVIQ